jgi:hypothetical protein
MSKIFDNKQMVHIASEVVVLIALVYYFNQKNKKLLGYIEDLSQRIEEQEDMIENHENMLRKIVEYINAKQTVSQTTESHSQVTKSHLNRSKPPVSSTRQQRKPPKKTSNSVLQYDTQNKKPMKAVRISEPTRLGVNKVSTSELVEEHSEQVVDLSRAQTQMNWEPTEIDNNTDQEDNDSILDIEIEEELRELDTENE